MSETPLKLTNLTKRFGSIYGRRRFDAVGAKGIDRWLFRPKRRR